MLEKATKQLVTAGQAHRALFLPIVVLLAMLYGGQGLWRFLCRVAGGVRKVGLEVAAHLKATGAQLARNGKALCNWMMATAKRATSALKREWTARRGLPQKDMAISADEQHPARQLHIRHGGQKHEKLAEVPHLPQLQMDNIKGGTIK